MRFGTFFDLALIGAASRAALCAVAGITGGTGSGGTTFDCYPDGSYQTTGTFTQAGTGITNTYCSIGEFANVVASDDFESYSAGSYSGGTPGASAVGLGTIYTR